MGWRLEGGGASWTFVAADAPPSTVAAHARAFAFSPSDPPLFGGGGGRWMWFGTQLYTVHGKAFWGAGDGRTHPGGLPPLLPRWRQTCITHLPQFIPQTRQAAKSPCKACIYLLYGQFTSHFHRGDDNIYELPMTPPDWASVRLHKSAEPLSFTQPPGSEWQPQLWTGGSQP